MKSIIKQTQFFAVFALCTSLGYSQAVKVNSAGNLGIGMEPGTSDRLSVNGTTYLNSSVGIGVAPSASYKLYVSGGNTYLNSNVGVGVAPSSSYKLYVSGGNTYLNSNVGIGVAPSSSYKLNVVGDTKLKGQIYIYSDLYPESENTAYFRFGGEGYYSTLSLCPYINNRGYIGYSNKALIEVWSYNHYTPSDARQKENFRDIENPLDIVLNLKGLKYDIKKEYAFDVSKIEDEKIKEKLDENRKNKIGFIAQDVFRVLPEAVMYNDSTDVYGIDYSKVVVVLVEAIKAHQQQINELKILVNNNKLKSAENTENIISIPGAALSQNIPNPFNVDTKIDYFLPEATKNATIYIYNMNGAQMKSYTLSERGNSSITINGSELTAGMYMYTMIADGQEVATKRMILTE